MARFNLLKMTRRPRILELLSAATALLSGALATTTPACGQIQHDESISQGIALRSQKWALPSSPFPISDELLAVDASTGDAATTKRGVFFENAIPASEPGRAGEMYGNIRVTLGKSAGQSEKLDSLLDGLASFLVKSFGTKEGTYLLAIEVWDHAKTKKLVSEPLITATYVEGRFLWFVTKREESNREQIQSDPLRYYEFSALENKVSVVLSAQWTNKRSFDAASYQKGVETARGLGLLKLFAPSLTTNAVLGAVVALASLVAGQNEKSEAVASRDMNFSDFTRDGKPLAKSADFIIPVTVGNNKGKNVIVRVELTTSLSKYSEQKKGAVKPDAVYNNLKAFVGTTEILLEKFLLENGEDSTKELLSAIDSGGVSKLDDKVMQKGCKALKRSLFLLFNDQDAVFAHWAIVGTGWAEISQHQKKTACYSSIDYCNYRSLNLPPPEAAASDVKCDAPSGGSAP